MKQYKAYDFKTGNTYLIGEHESKIGAEDYCKEKGIYTCPQAVVALTEDEYAHALENRRGE